MSQLVNAEVNSSNRKVVLASNYPTRIRGRHAALRNALCINNYTIKLHTHTDSFRYAKQHKGGRVRFFLVVLRGCQLTRKHPVFLPRTSVIFFLASCCCRMKLDTCERFWLPST